MPKTERELTAIIAQTTNRTEEVLRLSKTGMKPIEIVQHLGVTLGKIQSDLTTLQMEGHDVRLHAKPKTFQRPPRR